jgi:methionine-rich copper-binding protein CopC
MKRSSFFAVLLFLPVSAEAHAFLDDAMPKVGSVVTVPLKELRLHYTQSPETAFSHIMLVGPNGQTVATGPISIDPADPETLIAPVTGSMVPGHYEVKWDVISVDTHHTDGHFPFDYQP